MPPSTLAATTQTTTEEAADIILAHVGADLRTSGRNVFNTALNDLGNRTKVSDARMTVQACELLQQRGYATLVHSQPARPFSFLLDISLTAEGQARADRLNNCSLRPGDSHGRFPRVTLAGAAPVIADFTRLVNDGDHALGIGTAGDLYLMTKVAGKCYSIEFSQVVV